MDLLKNFTIKNQILARVVAITIIVISVCIIGYLLGKFAWYVSR